MKVCAYIMTVDSGLAPNPFHGVCTLSVCTPNHARANLKTGDYIVGVAGSPLCLRIKPYVNKLRLIYAMKVDERISLSSYYANEKYNAKIPKISGKKLEMCGDNFYKTTPYGVAHTRETNEHIGDEIEAQDRNGDRVFVGTTFFYFGSLAPVIPEETGWGGKLIRQLDMKRRGLSYIYGGSCRYRWSDEERDEFLAFIETNKLQRVPEPVDFQQWCDTRNSSCS